MRIVAANLTSVPVIVDAAGHQLGAGEFTVVDDGDDVTADALAAGKIGEADEPENLADVSPSARAAFTQLGGRSAGAADEEPAGEQPAKKTAAARKATS